MEEVEEGGRVGGKGGGGQEEGEEEGRIDFPGDMPRGRYLPQGGDGQRGILGTRRDIHREKSF